MVALRNGIFDERIPRAKVKQIILLMHGGTYQ